MPVIKSAKKKLRQDKKREKANKIFRLKLRDALKDARKTKSLEKITSSVKLVDKAVGKHILHKNKAARIKSRLSKLVKTASHPLKSTPKKRSK